MKCWNCGAELIWCNDYSFEDYGFEGDGIITEFLCSTCPAQVTSRISFSESE